MNPKKITLHKIVESITVKSSQSIIHPTAHVVETWSNHSSLLISRYGSNKHAYRESYSVGPHLSRRKAWEESNIVDPCLIDCKSFGLPVAQCRPSFCEDGPF